MSQGDTHASNPSFSLYGMRRAATNPRGRGRRRETVGRIARDRTFGFHLFPYHSYFLRHSYVERVYPNDFAQWVAMEVRDHVLGERLSVVDPFEFRELESLRAELISVIDDHLSRTPIVPRVMFGEPFYFNKSRIIQVPTRTEVETLLE